MRHPAHLAVLGLSVVLSISSGGCRSGEPAKDPESAEPPERAEPAATEIFAGFLEWVAQERTTAGENVPKDHIICVTEDRADPLYGTCSATSFRMVRWYEKSRKAFLFQSEASEWTAPSCSSLGARELRRWTTTDGLAFRCLFLSGPLAGLELHIAHDKEDTFTRLQVWSPEYLKLNRSWRDTMANEGR